MNKSSSQSVIVVTGANKGIGYAIVEKLLESQVEDQILLTARDQQRGQEAVAKLAEKFPNKKTKLIYVQLDVSSEESIKKFIQYVKDTKSSIKILINNAAIFNIQDIFDQNFYLEENQLKQQLNTNVYGLINLTEGLLPYLSNDGKVINISSMAGAFNFHSQKIKEDLDQPGWDLPQLIEYVKIYENLAVAKKQAEEGYTRSVYCFTKVIVNAYTRWVLVKHLKDDQTCFTIHPGEVKTEGTNFMGKIGVEEGTYSTLKCVGFNLEESKKYNGLFFNFDGSVIAW